MNDINHIVYFKLKNLFTKNKIVFSSNTVEWIREVVQERIDRTLAGSCDLFHLNEIIHIIDFILDENYGKKK